MLDASYGFKIASLLEKFRESPNSSGLSSVYGEFVEFFLQRLDYQSVVRLLERIDLGQSLGLNLSLLWSAVVECKGVEREHLQ